MKVYGEKGYYGCICNLSIEESKDRLGRADHPYVCTVNIVQQLHTIRLRKDDYGGVSEIEFVGTQDSHKTDEFNSNSCYKWHDFKLEENETVIGVYGSSFTQDYNKKFTSLGFILSTQPSL